MFKISHYANSFISVQGKNSTIVCDPWIGTTTDNGWYSYPLQNERDINSNIFNSRFVYISHLHCDHIDPKTLKKFKNKNLTFIIKKFENGTLKKRLKNLFPKNKIIEIKAFKKKKINKDFTVAIIPQIISNTSNLPDHIEYDLDTSILIQSNITKKVFYNNVDMPINLKILKKISQFSKKIFKKKIDIFCCALGAASEFPQCFLNLNRKKIQKRIINDSLRKLNDYLNFLKPEVFFPAGGTYAIYGKFYKLNKYIAQPSFYQIKKVTSKFKTKVCNIIGGGKINFDGFRYIIRESKVNISNNLNKNFVNLIKNKKYYYEENKNKIDINNLDDAYNRAKINYFRILSFNKKINTGWNIDFNIYRNYELNKKCLIDKKKSKFLKTYNLNYHNGKSKNFHKLECYIEYKLFNSLLNGRFPWNTSLTGSTIMYRRSPNIFNVDLQFSLNFLRA